MTAGEDFDEDWLRDKARAQERAYANCDWSGAVCPPRRTIIIPPDNPEDVVPTDLSLGEDWHEREATKDYVEPDLSLLSDEERADLESARLAIEEAERRRFFGEEEDQQTNSEDRQSRSNSKPTVKTRLPPPPDRSLLTLPAWLERDLPLRDFLMGGVMCTTSRWLIFGETGIGKTLIAMEIAAAIAVAAAFLKWAGQRRARVMYLDGELPMETFKERVQLIADRHGKDIEFYGYNREALGDEAMPPLNTEAGQAWIKREIAAIKPDLIVFDSIMCLLIGSMSEEATWMPVRPFVRWLSAQRIAQIWLHHANDIGKSFGDKTREWEMEAVVKLSKVEKQTADGLGEIEEGAILFEFVKARLRKPETAAQFAPIVIHTADWEFEGVIKSGGKRNEVEAVADAFLSAFDRLADGATKSSGFDGKPVPKVKVDAIRDELKKRGFLEKNEKGQLTSTGKSHFRRAKTALMSAGKILENEDLIWRK